MKKLIAFASILATAVSCNVEELNTFDTQPAPSLYGYTEDDNSTKTGLSVDEHGKGTILWNPAEKINVFFGTK